MATKLLKDYQLNEEVVTDAQIIAALGYTPVNSANIKTINGNSIVGSGDITVGSDSNIDGGNPSSSYTVTQVLDGEGV